MPRHGVRRARRAADRRSGGEPHGRRLLRAGERQRQEPLRGRGLAATAAPDERELVAQGVRVDGGEDRVELVGADLRELSPSTSDSTRRA
jgi:hypothetical protein